MHRKASFIESRTMFSLLFDHLQVPVACFYTLLPFLDSIGLASTHLPWHINSHKIANKFLVMTCLKTLASSWLLYFASGPALAVNCLFRTLFRSFSCHPITGLDKDFLPSINQILNCQDFHPFVDLWGLIFVDMYTMDPLELFKSMSFI